MTRVRSLPVLATIVALCAAPPALAGPLVPAKASQVVTLTGSNGSPIGCGNALGYRYVDARVLADGTKTPFTIPAKKVLVLRSGEITVTLPASGGADFGIIVGDASSVGATLLDRRIAGEGSTRRTVSFDFGEGVVLRAGKSPCFAVIGAGGGASVDYLRLDGFLAADN